MEAAVPTLNLTVEDGTPPLLKVSGEADFQNRDRIYNAVRELMERGSRTVRADLSEVSHLDSGALATLVRCANEALEAGGSLELTGASAQVCRIMTQCGAAALFRCCLQDIPVDGSRVEKRTGGGFWRVSDFSLPASPEAASAARQRIAELVCSIPMNLSDRADVMIAFGEAIANAIVHGCDSDPGRTVGIKCVAGPGRLTIDVRDPGNGFDPEKIPKPTPRSIVDGGMGIHIMRELMDEVRFFFSDGTTARLVKYI